MNIKRLILVLTLMLLLVLGCLPSTTSQTTNELPVIHSFKASPDNIKSGEASELSWIVSGASIVKIDQNIGEVKLEGTSVVTPTETSTYTLTATNQAGTSASTIHVVVSGANPSPNPVQPKQPLEPEQSSELQAVITKIIGKAKVLKAGETNWLAASVGDTVNAGDRVQTTLGSSAQITFMDGSSIYLDENTEVGISELNIEQDTGLTIIKLWQEIGQTKSRVEKLVDPASRYEVETPAGSVVTRGSTGIVIVYKDGKTHFINIDGNWYVFSEGQELPVPPGYQIILIPGRPPSGAFIYGESGDGSSGGGGPRPPNWN